MYVCIEGSNETLLSIFDSELIERVGDEENFPIFSVCKEAHDKFFFEKAYEEICNRFFETPFLYKDKMQVSAMIGTLTENHHQPLKTRLVEGLARLFMGFDDLSLANNFAYLFPLVDCVLPKEIKGSASAKYLQLKMASLKTVAALTPRKDGTPKRKREGTIFILENN